MKLKLIAGSIISIFACASFAQEVRYAKVVSVFPIETQVQSYEPRNICTKVQVPVYKDIPYQVRVETPVVTHREYRDSSSPILGMLIGAAIGNRIFSGDARIAGTFLGAAVGHGVGNSNSSTHTYVTTHSSYVTEYRKEFQGVTWQDECRVEQTLVSRNIVSSYQVTYVLNGVSRTVNMNSHPGEHVRVITTTTVEP